MDEGGERDGDANHGFRPTDVVERVRVTSSVAVRAATARENTHSPGSGHCNTKSQPKVTRVRICPRSARRLLSDSFRMSYIESSFGRGKPLGLKWLQ